MSGKRFTLDHNSSLTELCEQLADLEHQQWIYYSKDVSKQILRAKSLQELQDNIKNKWPTKWVEYSLLPEKEKEKDRIWAYKVLKIIEDNEAEIRDTFSMKGSSLA